MPTDAELAGTSLHGDDFDLDAIHQWYVDEENAFAELYALQPDYEYEYESVNRLHGFDRLPKDRRFRCVLGLGSAFGDELRPIEHRMDRLVIVESADAYKQAPALGVPTEWRKAAVTGDLDLPDEAVDLVTCFGVLHHIPNVTHVMREMARVTASGGYVVLREPVVSMGDWTRPRPGLTTRERGIPHRLLRRAATDAGFTVVREAWCFFSVFNLLESKFGIRPYTRPALVRLDAAMSWLFRWNYRYHPSNRWQKVRPTSLFMVLRKD